MDIVICGYLVLLVRLRGIFEMECVGFKMVVWVCGEVVVELYGLVDGGVNGLGDCFVCKCLCGGWWMGRFWLGVMGGLRV